MGNEERLEALGLTISELAAHLDVTRQYVIDWIDNRLPAAENDIIEVGVSLLEMHFSMYRRDSDAPTERISLVA